MAIYIQKWFNRQMINRLPKPYLSPDLNPKESLLADPKSRDYKTGPRNLDNKEKICKVLQLDHSDGNFATPKDSYC